MSNQIVREYIAKTLRDVDEWKLNLALTLLDKWKDKANIVSMPGNIIVFRPKYGKGWFACLYISKRIPMRISISDIHEKIFVKGLIYERAPGDQFEKNDYGDRRAEIIRETQLNAVLESVQKAYDLKYGDKNIMGNNTHISGSNDLSIIDDENNTLPLKNGFETEKSEIEKRNESNLEGDDEGDDVISEDSNISFEKMDRSLSDLKSLYEKGRLVIDPEWQREYVWDDKRASKLIESLLKNIPIPVIYLAKNNSLLEVIDGQQRLNSVFRFFKNEFKLQGLEWLKSQYENCYFKDLPEEIQNKLDDASIRTFELSSSTPTEYKFIIFERLNTGGMALSDMEIRNCIFRGKLNDLLKELAKDDNFKNALNQDNLSNRMMDRALVLRFLAFYEKTHSRAKKGLKRFINEFFNDFKNPTDEKLDEYRKIFRKAMQASYTVFGEHAFRLRKQGKKSKEWEGWANKPSAPIFQVITTSFIDYDLGQITRNADSIFEEYVDLISKDNLWVDYTRRATGEYQRIEYVFETWRNRLRVLLADTVANDKTRCFSRQLKDDMCGGPHFNNNFLKR